MLKFKVMSDIKKSTAKYPALTDWIDDFWGPNKFWNGNLFKNEILPAVNIKESKHDYTLEIAVPGMHKQDFEIEVDHNILRIEAKHKDEKVDEKENYRRKEFSYHSFKRQFTLPLDASEEEVKAKYDSGILWITLQKMKRETLDKRVVEIA
jgi:HSP20 family protein